MNPIIYITRGQIPDDVEARRREWFQRRHATDLVGIGFYSARGYRSQTVPQNCNVYELPDAALLSSDIYMQTRKADTFSPTVMKAFTYLSASIYTQVSVIDASGVPLARAPTIRGPVLAMLDFDTDERGESVGEWFVRNVVAAHRGQAGVRTLRLLEQRDAHPLFPPKEPRWCAVAEWAADPGSGADRLAALANGESIAMRSARFQTAAKWCALVREDVFDA
jgi:hypothetical protein